MSRLFDDASLESLNYAGAIVTAVPLTMACWFYPDDDTVSSTLMAIANDANNANEFRLDALGATGGDPISAHTRATSSSSASSSAGFTANTWCHACAVFASATSRAAYLNGGNKGTETTSRVPSGLNATAIGRIPRSTPTFYFSGRIAEAAIWNVALNDNEVAALATGISPMRIRPSGLVAYWPLYGTTDTARNIYRNSTDYSLTATGTTQAEHSPTQTAFFLPVGWAGSYTEPEPPPPPATEVATGLCLLGMG